MNVEVFLKSLTEEQADVCESDEKQLAEIFKAGWSEETAVQFHRAMLHARRINPATTVEGVFEVAFYLGLSFIGNEDVLARLNQAREDDVIMYGVQRRDSKDAGRTACIVSPDVAALAKLRRGKKRGVRGV
ncbi:MAG: hypothetical protein RB191_20515 [Terriglobia bacterium]|nr:hypothetical protein [Terriglobia bacterium]